MTGPEAKDKVECRLEGSGSAARRRPLTLRSKLPPHTQKTRFSRIPRSPTHAHAAPLTHARRAAGRLAAKSGKLKLKPHTLKLDRGRQSSTAVRCRRGPRRVSHPFSPFLLLLLPSHVLLRRHLHRRLFEWRAIFICAVVSGVLWSLGESFHVQIQRHVPGHAWADRSAMIAASGRAAWVVRVIGRVRALLPSLYAHTDSQSPHLSCGTGTAELRL